MEVNYNSFSRGWVNIFYWCESDCCGLLIIYERISSMEFFMVRIRIKFYLASSFFYIITISFGVRFRCNSSPKAETKSPAPSSQFRKRLNSFLYGFNGQMKQFPRYYTLSLEVIVEVRVLVPEYSFNSYLVAYTEFFISKHIKHSLTLA